MNFFYLGIQKNTDNPDQYRQYRYNTVRRSAADNEKTIVTASISLYQLLHESSES